jgi:hypothetical protein
MRLQTYLYGILSLSLGIILFSSTAFGEAKLLLTSLEVDDECRDTGVCADEYLFGLYKRTPKIDTVKVSETKKVKAKRNGKTRIVSVTTTKFVVEDYTWKDPAAAEKVGLSLKDYVIGGIDRNFREVLYRALRALDDAGLKPGITSAFRDDYRQSIATGYKAKNDCSYHGGSRHGGYGHGLAVDIVSVKGKTREERSAASEELWHWIDKHGKEFGIGRPYLDKDPPHVAPIDGKEYVAHRGRSEPVACVKKKEAPAPANMAQQASPGIRAAIKCSKWKASRERAAPHAAS